MVSAVSLSCYPEFNMGTGHLLFPWASSSIFLLWHGIQANVSLCLESSDCKIKNGLDQPIVGIQSSVSQLHCSAGQCGKLGVTGTCCLCHVTAIYSGLVIQGVPPFSVVFLFMLSPASFSILVISVGFSKNDVRDGVDLNCNLHVVFL